VRHIEMLGLPGSGKTTLFRDAIVLLRSHRDVFTEREARISGLRQKMRHPSGIWKKCISTLADLTGDRLWNLLWQNHRYAAMLRFIEYYPALAQFIIQAADKWPSPSSLPEASKLFHIEILTWTFNFFSTYTFIQESLRSDEMLFLEEGVCQQAYNLIAFQAPAVQQGDLERYLQQAPLPDCLILIDTAPEICEARMKARQRYPLLMQHLTPSERIAQLKHRHEMHWQIFRYFETHHLPAFVINNNDIYSTVQHILAQTFQEHEADMFSQIRHK